MSERQKNNVDTYNGGDIKGMDAFKIVEIGSYPPPYSGWSVRIKYLRDAFREKGYDCQVLNLGTNRRVKSEEYIDIQNGLHYIKNLIALRLKGYHFHVHVNAQAVKGPILGLLAILVSLLTFERVVLTFHGGLKQLYFPRKSGRTMYLIVWLNFLLPKVIVCNDLAIKKEISKYGLFIKEKKIHPIQAFSVQYLQYQAVSLPEKIESYLPKKKALIVSYIVLRNGFYIETLLDFLEMLPNDVRVVLTGIGKVEDAAIAPLQQRLLALEKRGVILMVKSLDHNQFMSLLASADIYLRTCVSDGVASSVLEALSVGTQVVASENGRRPEGVVTYKATDAKDMSNKVERVLANLDTLNTARVLPEVEDTVESEVTLLRKVFLQ